ncbi:unnamed protein product [Caenorhabditis brenneri]
MDFVKQRLHVEAVDLCTSTVNGLVFQEQIGFAEDPGQQPWYVNYNTHKEVGGFEIMNHISGVLQSAKTISLDGGMAISMNIYKEKPPKNVTGNGDDDDSVDDEEIEESDYESGVELEDPLPKNGLRQRRAQRSHFLKKHFGKPFVVGPTHCLPKTLAIGKLKVDLQNTAIKSEEKAEMKKLYLKATRNDKSQYANNTAQLTMAKDLLKQAGTAVDQESHTRDDLVKLVLLDYQIKLYVCESRESMPRKDCHPNTEGKKFIGIVHYNNHFDCIRALRTRISFLSFCRTCFNWGDSNHYKKCSIKCWNCGWTTCSGKGNRARFAGAPHVCGNTSICRRKNSGSQECQHPLPTKAEKERKKKAQEKWTMVFYDMECVVVESGQYTGPVILGPTHNPNMIVAKIICNNCRGESCDSCGDALLFSYKDGNTLGNYVKFLLKDSRLNGARVIAHNGGRYDHALLLRGIDDYLGEDAPSPSLVTNGLTIIRASLTHKKRTLHFLDSFQFMQMGLAKMPNAFGLTGEAKGFFPYLYNHPDNYDKVLKHLPPKEYYSPDTMSAARKKEFDEWYAEEYHQGFNLFDEMEKYCRSDMMILVKAVVCFMSKCESIFDGWNPFLNSCTLASYVMLVLRNLFIKPGDVGVLPENGYGGGKNSKLALKYILWLVKTTPGLVLQHKLSGGEKRIRVKNGRTYYADAYDEKTKTVDFLC